MRYPTYGRVLFERTTLQGVLVMSITAAELAEALADAPESTRRAFARAVRDPEGFLAADNAQPDLWAHQHDLMDTLSDEATR